MDNIFQNYNKCVFCNSSSWVEKKQLFKENFYVKAIKSDLKISDYQLKKMKVYECQKCHILQNNPWFTKDISRKIYSNIYGQHNRSWSNVINFFKKEDLPDHGLLFNLISKKIKIKNYAEYNAPFMGLFLNFFKNEYKSNKNFYKDIFKNTISYLTSRQVAGESKRKQKTSFDRSRYFLKKINFLKKKNIKKKRINKFLFVDNSSLAWGQNDNYKSINSRSFSSELLDLKIKEFNQNNLKLDVFGIFHTLDHTFQPSKIFDFALKNSKYVIVYCHKNENLSKQHLFSLTDGFLKYLNKKKIHVIDLTNIIQKIYKSPELYFLCTKQKKYINKFKELK